MTQFRFRMRTQPRGDAHGPPRGKFRKPGIRLIVTIEDGCPVDPELLESAIAWTLINAMTDENHGGSGLIAGTDNRWDTRMAPYPLPHNPLSNRRKARP